MASLMENLISILEEECKEYDNLLKLSISKTPVIVSENLDELARITDDEQLLLSRLSALEKKRVEVVADIANVLNKDVETLKIKKLIKMMGGRPAEQRALAEVYDKLMAVARNVELINARNSELIQSALDMVHFNMNIMQSAKTAPSSANYNRGATNTGDTLGINRRSFDARQ